MNKKEAAEKAKEKVVQLLMKTQDNLRNNLRRNKYQMKKLVDEQTVAKCEIAHTGALLKSWGDCDNANT